MDYLGDYISAITGLCPLKFLCALEIDQSLLAHTTIKDEVHQNIIVKI